MFDTNAWVVADVWEKDVWDFQAKSGSSGSCPLCLHFLGKLQVTQCLGKCLEVPDMILADILLPAKLRSRDLVPSHKTEAEQH